MRLGYDGFVTINAACRTKWALIAVAAALLVSALPAQTTPSDSNLKTYLSQRLTIDPGEQVGVQRGCCLIGPIEETNLEWTAGQAGSPIREWEFFTVAGRDELSRNAWWHHAFGVAGNRVGLAISTIGGLAVATGVAGLVYQISGFPIKNGYYLAGGLILGGAALAVAGHFVEQFGDRRLTKNSIPRHTARRVADEHNQRLRTELRIPDAWER